jgi:hypothetical protein
MHNTRRTFMMTVAASGAAITLGAHAQATMLDEKNPQAAALGYAADSTNRCQEIPQTRRHPALQQLRAVPGQSHRRGRRLPPVCGQAGGRQRLVQRLGQEGLMSRVGT